MAASGPSDSRTALVRLMNAESPELADLPGSV